MNELFTQEYRFLVYFSYTLVIGALMILGIWGRYVSKKTQLRYKDFCKKLNINN